MEINEIKYGKPAEKTHETKTLSFEKIRKIHNHPGRRNQEKPLKFLTSGMKGQSAPATSQKF